MEFLNFILNIVALCLWGGAFIMPRYAVQSSQPLTLLSTLRSETPRTYGRLFFLGSLIAFLVLRAVAFWNFGSATSGVPSLDFGLLEVTLQKASFVHMLWYSVGSFLIFLYCYYLCVVGLSLSCRQRQRMESIENLINQQIGSLALWHPGLKVAAMGGLGGMLWLGMGLVLIRLDALPENWTWMVLVMQGPVLAAGWWLVFVLVMMVVLALHLLHSYVYLGERVLWQFIDATAKDYLAAFRILPLVVGRVDFAPILGLLAYWVFYRFVGWGLQLVFERLSG